MGQSELTILDVPPDTTISCEDDIGPDSLGEITASTTCTGEVTVIYTDESDFASCLETITRTFTATDECGNTASAIQTISIVDTTAPVFEGVIEVEWPCDEEIPVMVTVSDNCSEEVDLSWEDIMFVSGCAGSIFRDFTAVDACGNISTFFQSITFVDEVAPVFTIFPEDVTVECNNIPGVEAEIDFSDNCSEAYPELISFDGEEIVGEGCEYQLERTYTISDLCGNSTSAVWTVTVADTTAPTFTLVPEDLEIECDEEIPATEATAEDGCGEVTITSSDEVVEGDCSITRTFVATDECGNSSSAFQTITVVDTIAPVFTSVPEDLEIECGEEIPVSEATAEDNCGEVAITFSDDFTEGDCTITRTFFATDECGNSATAIQTISIIEDTTPPVIEGEIEVDVACDADEVPVMVTVTDNCNEFELTYEDTSYGGGGCTANYYRVYTATDVCGNSSTFEQIITFIDEEDPVFDNFPEDLTVECDQVPSNDGLEIEYSDNCTSVMLEYSGEEIIDSDCPQSYTIERTWFLADACYNNTSATWTITVVDTTAPVFTSVPEDFTIECGEEIPVTEATAEDDCGEVTVTYADESDFASCLETITRTFTATDDCGNTANAIQTFFIEDTTAPIFEGELEESWPCDEEIPVLITATDNCNEFEITYVDESISGGCAGRIIRDYTVTDICENSADFQQIITRTDGEAPEFTQFPEDVTVDCNNIPGTEAEIDFSDSCTGVSLSFNGEEVVGEGCEYQLERTYTLNDSCGNSASAVWTITVADTTPPEFTSIPEALEIECGEEIPETEATAVDNCGEVTISYSDEAIEGNCTTIRTFVATDECGNSSSAEWTITMIDDEAPAVECETTTVEITGDEGEAEVPDLLDSFSGSDNCSDNLTFEQTPSSGSILPLGSHTVTLTAYDDCGNAAGCEVTLDIVTGLEEILAGTIEVYPNPTDGLVEVVFPATPLANVILEVYSVNGQLISREELVGKASHQIDLSKEPSGLYFLHIRTGKGTVVKKLSRM
jgi:hypothetical protein